MVRMEVQRDFGVGPFFFLLLVLTRLAFFLGWGLCELAVVCGTSKKRRCIKAPGG